MGEYWPLVKSPIENCIHAFKDTGTYVEIYAEKSKHSQGKHGATVQHRALESAWRTHIGDVPRASKGVSDSCETAVCVTHKLGQEERRCIIHIVVIPMLGDKHRITEWHPVVWQNHPVAHFDHRMIYRITHLQKA